MLGESEASWWLSAATILVALGTTPRLLFNTKIVEVWKRIYTHIRSMLILLRQVGGGIAVSPPNSIKLSAEVGMGETVKARQATCLERPSPPCRA
jgi:hypothetical protein